MDAIGLLILIAVFQLKHFIADYLLQGKYMLGKFKLVGWELPLFAHASVHMAMTFLIVFFYLPFWMALILSVFDMMIHFAIDRLKVVLSRDYDSSKDKEFWWWLGADQMAHHYTHYAIAFAVFILVNMG